jgi:hypothetical protein
MYNLMAHVGKKWVFTVDLGWQIGVGVAYDKIFDVPRFRLDVPGFRFELERLSDGDNGHARTDLTTSLKDLVAALEAKGLNDRDLEKLRYPLQHYQWVSGGSVKINKATSGTFADGYCFLIDDQGRKHLWPALKTQADIEEACTSQAMNCINIVQILMSESDYDSYVNCAYAKERIVLAAEGY